MSIIYDALKKVQRSFENGKASPIFPRPKRPAVPPPQPPREDKPLFYSDVITPAAQRPSAPKKEINVLIVVILCGFLFTWGMVFVALQDDQRPTAPILRSIEPPPVPKGQVVLNGIITTGNKRAALINNEIYEVGEEVEGKLILEILPNEVRVQDGEKIRTIKVRKRR